MEWGREDFAKSELQQSWRTPVPDIQKVPLQGSYSVPAESVFVLYRNVKVSIKKNWKIPKKNK